MAKSILNIIYFIFYLLFLFINIFDVSIFTKKEKGLSYARYFGILKSRGRYIAFLDSDDEWKKNKLMKQIKFMKNHQSVFSCTNFQLKKNNNINKKYIKVN